MNINRIGIRICNVVLMFAFLSLGVRIGMQPQAYLLPQFHLSFMACGWFLRAIFAEWNS